ncbi:MAG TPA: hypothetical protein ENN99_07435 [Chloroflexi bacterium]|nr:hypothetical protein [Chloroflexota bacterium]
MERKRKVVGLLIMLAATVLACTCNFLPGTETSPTVPAAEPVNALFQDDFSDKGTGWEVGNYDGGSVGYKEDRYFVTSIANGSTMWGVANRSFDNLIIAVDAIQIAAGPDDNNDYGIVCREQGNGDGYYLLISGDGFYSIMKSIDGQFIELASWTESAAIKTGNATNHLQAVCNGSSLKLSINGQEVATAEDSTYTSGDIALTATTYEDQPTEIHFDNLVVSSP